MSTVAEPKQKQASDKPKVEDKEVRYTPAGASEEMVLSVGFVKNFLTTPTKNGKHPSYQDVVKFMMLCKARGLNPWEGDAYLTGYDNRDGTASFSLITAIQALLKRAEASPDFAGIESGVIVIKDEEVIERRGTLLLAGETLVGGWAKCYRKGWTVDSYASVQLATYDSGYSRWAKDKAGMIAKVARAAVLRETFPTYLGGLYTEDEMGAVEVAGKTLPQPRKNEPIRLTRTETVVPEYPEPDVFETVPSEDPYAKAAAEREARLAAENAVE